MFACMGMQVNVRVELLVSQPLQILGNGSGARVFNLVSIVPIKPIQILTIGILPVVSPVDSVWVYHRNQLEDEHSPQSDSLDVFGTEKRNQPVHHMRAWSLSWMHSRRHEDVPLVGKLEGSLFLVDEHAWKRGFSFIACSFF